jgi:hypothetical protein
MVKVRFTKKKLFDLKDKWFLSRLTIRQKYC